MPIIEGSVDFLKIYRGWSGDFRIVVDGKTYYHRLGGRLNLEGIVPGTRVRVSYESAKIHDLDWLADRVLLARISKERMPRQYDEVLGVEVLEAAK